MPGKRKNRGLPIVMMVIGLALIGVVFVMALTMTNDQVKTVPESVDQVQRVSAAEAAGARAPRRTPAARRHGPRRVRRNRDRLVDGGGWRFRRAFRCQAWKNAPLGAIPGSCTSHRETDAGRTAGSLRFEHLSYFERRCQRREGFHRGSSASLS